ncbi:MAG: hypothetical protein ACO3VI_12200, partial [Ilumatobacteraceae bacterium]
TGANAAKYQSSGHGHGAAASPNSRPECQDRAKKTMRVWPEDPANRQPVIFCIHDQTGRGNSADVTSWRLTAN